MSACTHNTTTMKRAVCACHVTCACRQPDAHCHKLPTTTFASARVTTTLPTCMGCGRLVGMCDCPPFKEDLAEQVNHPAHYGGEANPYEAIKVIEAWKVGFNLGTVLKYIARHEHKGTALVDLEKAAWYLAREIETRKREGK